MSPILGYYNMRGMIGEPIRGILEFTETKFEDKSYPIGPAPDYKSVEWSADKKDLDVSFPNLPYWIDGDVKVTQSLAIVRYLGRKYKLMGQTEQEHCDIDALLMECYDLRMKMFTYFYRSKQEYEETRNELVEHVNAKFDTFSKVLGDKKFFIGNDISVADFVLYEKLYVAAELLPECLSQQPKLVAFKQRYESIPQIAAYMKSSRFRKGPINAPMAAVGTI